MSIGSEFSKAKATGTGYILLVNEYLPISKKMSVFHNFKTFVTWYKTYDGIINNWREDFNIYNIIQSGFEIIYEIIN